MRYTTPLAMLIVALVAGPASAQPGAAGSGGLDSVRTVKGTQAGKIESLGREAVSLNRSGRTEKIPVGDILSIRFDGEPPQMNVARSAALAGRYEDALRDLERLEEELKTHPREELKHDFAFFKLYCTAQLALAGKGDVRQAGRQLREFIDRHRDSHHYYRANEVLGHLLVAVGSHDAAMQHYNELASAPWTEHQMRAAIAKARAHQAQGRHDAAETEFAAARDLAADAKSPLIESQKQIATLGLAECLAENQKVDESVALVEEIIKAADPEDGQLRARAYTTLGNCLRKGGRTKEAILAYLHVDQLYYVADPQAHAETLWNLVALWNDFNRPDRALQAQQSLQTRYANSPWNKK